MLCISAKHSEKQETKMWNTLMAANS